MRRNAEFFGGNKTSAGEDLDAIMEGMFQSQYCDDGGWLT